MKDNTKINIYVVCHKEAYVPESECFKAIQVGAANAPLKFNGMLSDNTGKNISEKNRSYCELTAQYWAWKNEDADYYGFFHYRRYFSFASDQNYAEDGYGNVVIERLTREEQERFQLDDQHILGLVADYDVITVRARDINEQRMHTRNKERLDNYAEYGESCAQHRSDLDKALEILREKYPEMSAAADRYMHSDKAYECNMFIMRKEIYGQYCTWLFDILFELEKKIDTTCYNLEELRVFGFIAERLFGIYYTWLKENASIKRLELQKVLIRNTEPVVRIDPIDKKYVPIVLAANDGFVPYLSTMIESILEHANPDRGYDIIVLHRDISADNQQRIQLQAAGYPYCSIRFANVQGYFDSLKLFVNQHLSIETYYRLVVQDLMPDYDKVLYLDSDMVTERDVAELYDTNIGECMIGAAKDIDIAGQVKTSSKMKDYVENQIGLKNPFDYFQAGVLILNLKAFRSAITADELLKIASEKEWKCHDQDVLNHVCQGRVYYIPQKWNVVMNWKEQDRSREKILKKAPADLYFEWLDARKQPLVVHFAGYQKPWNVPFCDMAPFFWKYSRNTPYYETIILKKSNINEQKPNRSEIITKHNNLLKGGIQCIRDHGVLYTCKLALWKIYNNSVS